MKALIPGMKRLSSARNDEVNRDGRGRHACGADTELRITWGLEERNEGCFRIFENFLVVRAYFL